MAAQNGRNPGQGRSRVSRAPAPKAVKTDTGPVSGKADLAENRAPRRGAGPTKVGSNTPVSRAAGKPPQVRDQSRSVTGTTIAQKANNAAGRRAKRVTLSAGDITETVRDMVEKAISAAGAGSEGISYAVTWSPADQGGQRVIAWMFMLTAPSLLFSQPPHAVATDPVMCGSVPSKLQVAAVVRECLPLLREARKAERDSAMADGASRSRLN